MIFGVIMNRFKLLLVFICFFFTAYVNAGEIVQGPYKITNDTASVQVENNDMDLNCPFTLMISNAPSSYELDKICENGDIPNIRSIFFMSLKGMSYIGTIVSWHNKHQAEGIDETNFEVRVYKKNKNGKYILDKEKTSDAVLTGTEDGTGDGSYKYNNAAAVKKYMKRKYG